MLTSDLNLSKNCKRIEILKCVLRTFIIIIIIIIIKNIDRAPTSGLLAQEWLIQSFFFNFCALKIFYSRLPQKRTPNYSQDSFFQHLMVYYPTHKQK